MAAFLFTCPVTQMKVQHWLDDYEDASEDDYEGTTCHACAGVHFVWIMGADNLRSFHRWQRWRDIAELVPIVVVDRLGPSLYATAGAAGHWLANFRLPESAARTLAERKPPAWIYLHGLKSPLSSTALRAARALQSS